MCMVCILVRLCKSLAICLGVQQGKWVSTEMAILANQESVTAYVTLICSSLVLPYLS